MKIKHKSYEIKMKRKIFEDDCRKNNCAIILKSASIFTVLTNPKKEIKISLIVHEDIYQNLNKITI